MNEFEANLLTLAAPDAETYRRQLTARLDEAPGVRDMAKMTATASHDA